MAEYGDHLLTKSPVRRDGEKGAIDASRISHNCRLHGSQMRLELLQLFFELFVH